MTIKALIIWLWESVSQIVKFLRKPDGLHKLLVSFALLEGLKL
jgi:hypothetical protein